MVIPISKFFKSIEGQTIDQAYLNSAEQWAKKWMEDSDEATRQRGRRVEGALNKIETLNNEYDELSRVAKGVLETPVTDFRIVFGKDELQMDKLTGTKTCQFALDLIERALRNNRSQYMEAYISLLKSVR